MREGFLSFDIEADGNNPVQHSMRSIGIALFSDNNREKPVDTFYRRLLPQKDTVPDPQCVSLFWDKYPQAWEHVTTDMEDARVVMADLSDWLSMNAGTYRLKWVAAPANFDWMFLKCYYERYGPPLKYDIGFFCHDLHSLIRAYVTIHRLTDVEQFKDTLAHGHMATHNALDDAVRQGVQYCSIRVLLGSKRQRTNGQPTKHKRVHNSA